MEITGKIGKTGEIGKKADNRLRMMCDRLSPKKRLFVVIVSLVLFAAIAVYMAVSSVYGINRTELTVEHIEGLKLQRINNDTVNTNNIFKIKDYDRK